MPKDEELILKYLLLEEKYYLFPTISNHENNIEWVLFNIYITILVMCIWIFIINRLFSGVLFDLYKYLEMPETSKK